MVLHGVRGAEELDLRVDLRAAVRSGAFVPGVVERKEPYGLFVRVGARVGLAHRSELPWPWPAVGSAVAARVLSAGDRVQLSLRPFALRGVRTERRPASDPVSEDVLVIVLSFLDRGALERCIHVSTTFRASAEEAIARSWGAYAVTCFHSKVRSDEGVVLGVGVRAELRRSLEAVFEPLAAATFHEEKVRAGVWKNRFNKFLPLAIDVEHFARALPEIRRTLPELLVREHVVEGRFRRSEVEEARDRHRMELRAGEDELQRQLRDGQRPEPASPEEAAAKAEDSRLTVEKGRAQSAVQNLRDVVSFLDTLDTQAQPTEDGLQVLLPKQLRSELWEYQHARRARN